MAVECYEEVMILLNKTISWTTKINALVKNLRLSRRHSSLTNDFAETSPLFCRYLCSHQRHRLFHIYYNGWSILIRSNLQLYSSGLFRASYIRTSTYYRYFSQWFYLQLYYIHLQSVIVIAVKYHKERQIPGLW